MAQHSTQAHPIRDQEPVSGRSAPIPILLAAGSTALVLLGTLALWFHYGTQVFFEMIRTGLAACF